MPIFTIFSYGFLYLTVISLWFPGKARLKLWQIFLIFAVVSGLIAQRIQLIALVPIISLPLAVYYSEIKKANRFIKGLAFLGVILISVGLAAHLFPGFHNLLILNQVYISKDAIPFTLYLNFDKALVGIFILGMSHSLLCRAHDWLSLYKKSLLQMLISILVITTLAMFLGFVRFEPKLPDSFFTWCITNLLLVSVAEEAFFRGFLQKKLVNKLKKIKFGNYLSILLVAILFGLVHYAGGIKYIILATVAGISYGLIYDRTKRIEASILTHFGLNLIHFIFFTYPMLAT
jgi:membrane protease YdiL (CAAX protease family)